MISMSERASPTGGTSGARSCTSDCASCETSNPTFRPSASKALVTGRTMSACSAVGLMNRSRCTWKSSAWQRVPAAGAVAVGHQQVRPEADEPARPVRTALEGRRVEVLPGDEPEAGRAERPVADPDRLRPLRSVEQFHPGDRVRRHGREQHVAPGSVEAASQRVQDVDGPNDLGRVTVLLEAAPRVERDGAVMPQHLRGVLDLCGGYARDLLRDRRRSGAALLGDEVERRPAGDRSGGRRHFDRPGEGEAVVVVDIRSRGRPGRGRPAGRRPRPRRRSDLRSPPGVSSLARSNRPVSRRTSSGPFVQRRTNALVVPATLDHHIVMASASAASVPGRTRSQRSALEASPARRGSTTISFAPRRSASRVAVAWARRDTDGL